MIANHGHELIFAHSGETRVAASVTLAGIVAMLIGGAFMVLGPQLPQDRPPGRDPLTNVPAVRVIDPAPRKDLSCTEQVWPYFDQRCLVRANASAFSGKPSANAAARDVNNDERLTPLSATGANVVGKVVSPQDAKAIAQQVAAPPRGAPSRHTRADGASDYLDDDASDLPPLRPRHVHRHLRLPFHGRIGPFRF